MKKTKQKIFDDAWNQTFQLAKSFYEENGHLLIPSDYLCNNIRLGRWIGTQRQNYQKKDNPFFTDERIKKLESIGMIWNFKNFSWQKMYKELEKYKKVHGNIRVPQSYITDNHLSLGIWLHLQRTRYKQNKISNYRKNKLEQLGIIWNPKKLIENSWDINFQLLKEYKKKFHEFPKLNYVTENGIKLGGWLSAQRQKYNQGKLLLERKTKLEKIGVSFNLYKDSWYKMYQQAKEFYSLNNTLDFRDFNGFYDKKLGVWLSRQRQQYFKGKLSPTQIKELEVIGMVWDVPKYYWNKMYERAKKFYLTYGHLHVSKNPNTSKDYKLGRWLDSQRKMYRMNHRITKDHIERLESIGMIWDLYKSPQQIWEEWYLKAKEFYQKNHHLNPKKSRLKTWLFAQRAAKKGLRGKITAKQIELLEQIGMIWDIKEANWNRMYEYAKKYYQIHGMLNVPVNYVTENKDKLGIWIARQRNVYKHIRKNNQTPNKMMKKRIELLNQINMIWDASKLTVKTSFQEKAIFYYLTQIYDNVQKISQWEFIGYELDIYIPSIKTAIEYDGIFHKHTLKNDNKKNKACKEHGITLIRLREPGLPKVADCPVVINLSDHSDEAFEIAIRKLFSYLKINCDFCNLNEDRSKILQTYKDYTSRCWDSNYEKLYLHYKCNKDFFPITDKNLRYWINRQRDDYKNGLLTPFQIKKLKKINFDFGPYESRWMEMYQLATNYYHDYGTLKIPHNYTTIDGVCLGLWIYKQKRLYKNNKLDLNHIKLLEKLEINWNLKEFYNRDHDITKSNYFKELKKYYEKNGNIDITIKYTSDSGLNLGKWLSSLRKDYKNKRLNKDAIIALNTLKIKWDVFNDRWEDMFTIAKDYYLKHGDILISANYITEDGIHLGDWISRQRQKFNHSGNNKLLTQKQIKKLNSIGMIWNPYEKKWMNNYELAKKFYKKNGHLNIPINYVTEDGIKLGMWINTQRQANRGNPNYLMTTSRKELLDKIHMNWELRHPRPNAKKRTLIGQKKL